MKLIDIPLYHVHMPLIHFQGHGSKVKVRDNIFPKMHFRRRRTDLQFVVADCPVLIDWLVDLEKVHRYSNRHGDKAMKQYIHACNSTCATVSEIALWNPLKSTLIVDRLLFVAVLLLPLHYDE